jgi:hypothetical protein
MRAAVEALKKQEKSETSALLQKSRQNSQLIILIS